MKKLKVGNYIKDQLSDWHCVVHIYGSEKTISVIGLGKSGTYPMEVEDIVEKKDFTNYLELFMKGRSLLWRDKEERFFLTVLTKYNLDGVTYQKAEKNVYTKARLITELEKLEYVDIDEIAYIYQINGWIMLKEYDEVSKEEVYKDVMFFKGQDFTDLKKIKLDQKAETHEEDIVFEDVVLYERKVHERVKMDRCIL